MPWFYAVVEREHELQNPTSPEKIRLLGERLRLGPESRILDIASGRGGPAILLAATFGCRITCVEASEEFHAAALARVREAALEELIGSVHADARTFRLEPSDYDAALCLGASFVWGGLEGTLEALVPVTGQAGSSRSESRTGGRGRCRRGSSPTRARASSRSRRRSSGSEARGSRP